MIRRSLAPKPVSRLLIVDSDRATHALLKDHEQGARSLVVDMAQVNFIDSSGLGALVSALKALKTKERNGDIKLANVQPPVSALLEIIRLQRVFSSYGSVDQAVQSFS